MNPPKYADLGKSSKDLFDKGFNYGFVKVDLKHTASNGVGFTSKGSSSMESGLINGTLETKFKAAPFNITEKWTTDNKLTTEISMDNQFIEGTKVQLNTNFAPSSGKKSAAVKAFYACDKVNMTMDSDITLSGPTIQGSIVTGHLGWLAGYQFGFDTAQKVSTKNNFALGYNTDDLQILCTANDMTKYEGSVFQKVKSGLQVGIKLSWAKDTNATTFGVASKYTIDDVSSVCMKLNNAGQIGVGYSHKLNDGITFSASSLVEGSKLNESGHKMGLGLEFSV